MPAASPRWPHAVSLWQVKAESPAYYFCAGKRHPACLLMNVIGACFNPHNTQVARHDILDEAGEEEKIVPGEDESEYEKDKDVADHREL